MLWRESTNAAFISLLNAFVLRCKLALRAMHAKSNAVRSVFKRNQHSSRCIPAIRTALRTLIARPQGALLPLRSITLARVRISAKSILRIYMAFNRVCAAVQVCITQYACEIKLA